MIYDLALLAVGIIVGWFLGRLCMLASIMWKLYVSRR